MKDLNELKNGIDLRVYAGRYLNGQHHYDYDQVGCPFHGGTGATPSLTIWSDHFHCFTCGAHGSVIDFVMLYENKDLQAAVEVLEKELPLHENNPPKRHQERKRPKISMDTVMENFEHIQEGMPYFHRRQITDATCYKNKLGVNPRFRSYYQAQDKDTLYMFHSKRYAVPNIFEGSVRAINYRRDDIAFIDAFFNHPDHEEVMVDLEERLGYEPDNQDILTWCGGPKYQQEKGSLWRPFNVGLIKKREEGKLVSVHYPYLFLHAESKEFDTLALMDAGYPTVGVQVTSELISVLPALFEEIPMLYIIRDNDEPGLAKAQRLQEVLGRGRIVAPIDGLKDTGEVLQAGLAHKMFSSGLGLEPILKL